MGSRPFCLISTAEQSMGWLLAPLALPLSWYFPADMSFALIFWVTVLNIDNHLQQTTAEDF